MFLQEPEKAHALVENIRGLKQLRQNCKLMWKSFQAKQTQVSWVHQINSAGSPWKRNCGMDSFFEGLVCLSTCQLQQLRALFFACLHGCLVQVRFTNARMKGATKTSFQYLFHTSSSRASQQWPVSAHGGADRCPSSPNAVTNICSESEFCMRLELSSNKHRQRRGGRWRITVGEEICCGKNCFRSR